MDNIYNIKNLPVPNLDETLEKYFQWVSTLLSKEELQEVKISINNFKKGNGISLQNYLINKSCDKNSSWLIDWWIKYSYLSSRGPVSPECNAGLQFILPKIENETSVSQISKIIYSVTNLYLEIKKNGVPKLQVKGKDISLDQLEGAFSAIREPGETFDNYYINEKTSNNVIFLYKNKVFNIEVVKNNELVDFNTIENAITEIVNNETTVLKTNFNNISAATNRDEAAKVFSELKDRNDNYKLVQDAIIAISLDDCDVNNSLEVINNCYSTENFNRWHGKSISINVANNGVKTIVADHTYIDGSTEIYIIDYVNSFIENNLFTNENSNKANFNELTFNIDGFENKLDQFLNEFNNYLSETSYDVVELNIDRNYLKENGVLSADGYIHLLYQLAQFDLFNKFENTYVAVDVRNFFKGRTECLRPITAKSVKFIEEYHKKELNNEQLKSLLIDSLNEHYKRLKECQNGNGVNRHLTGLKLAAKELGVEDEFFKTKGFSVIESNVFSTSSLVHPLIDLFFFQQVCDDGYGIAYSLGEKAWLTISSKNSNIENRKEFVNKLNFYIEQLNNLIKN